MTTVEAEVLDEFDLDIQIDETDHPVREYAPHAQTPTQACSCTVCCVTNPCTVNNIWCSVVCN